MKKTIRIKWWWVAIAFVITAGLFLLNANLRERIYWKASEWYSDLFYAFNPPEEAVFVPQEAESIQWSTATMTPTATPMAEPTTEEGQPTSTVTPTLAPTATPEPLPASVVLEGVTFTDQHGKWNYCAPANLTMALSYWGWDVTREEVGQWLKPEDKDRNVKPYEMADYIEEQTNLGVLVRVGGDLEILKTLIAHGYPVLIEKGLYMPRTPGSSQILWMGHYNLLVGYDEAKQEFVSHDSYLSPPEYPAFLPISYDDLYSQWRSFNYIFLVVYPVNQQDEVFRLMGNYLDFNWAVQKALEIAEIEMEQLEGEELFFAKFNYAGSLTLLFDYGPASVAFDDAFAEYAELDPNRRPFRMVWYQTEPYYAYFYSGRYQDVIDLATTTLEASSEPFLEESWYWRAQAKSALGDINGAVADFRESLRYHPGFGPSLEALALLGYEP
ncbi:MAG: C39 family peptidase [Anaerolineae bacterium]|nr:C39 family peptidase [Anaerolineae bacterium]